MISMKWIISFELYFINKVQSQIILNVSFIVVIQTSHMKACLRLWCMPHDVKEYKISDYLAGNCDLADCSNSVINCKFSFETKIYIDNEINSAWIAVVRLIIFFFL